MRGCPIGMTGRKWKSMKLRELMRYCAIKKNDNFRLIDTYYITDSERILLLSSLIDDRIEKHFFDFSDKLLGCNQIQTDIECCKTCLRFAKTIDERQEYIYKLDIYQELLNDMILSLLI